jgi:cobalt/nickel transport system permease protein
MHIPDGYLGPITYIAMFIIMVPIWFYAGYRVRKDLRSKQVPLLALSAAFTFIIMMFNIPIPGGSTGHAVGGAIIGIILGPWAAIVSISVALIIQAFVFGDGGITAIGANCFNMAVVMPFVGYYAYKLISGNSDLKSTRRIVAAVIAGYLSLTIASGFAGFEFGIQPILHPAVNGQFPYMPYGLSVTMPAMLSEHMIFFGVLEALITGLVFLYFQRNAPDMLQGKKPKQKTQNKVPV